MNLPLTLFSVSLLGLGVAACGGTSREGSHPSPNTGTRPGAAGSPAASVTPTASYFEGDHDVDDLNPSHKDPDDNSVRYFGHAPSVADRRAITLLVKRYYAAARAGDGSAGCSLISPRLAKGPGLGDLAERAYPPAPSAPPLRGESCVRIVSLLFKEAHARLAGDAAGLTITSARIKGRRGLVILGFRTTPERYISVERENGVWGMDALLDRELR